MIPEIHLTKKDFKIVWYSGTGAGGQHRNKHLNCCRITHIESGLSANGTGSRSRVTNQNDAFRALVPKLLEYYSNPTVRDINNNTIRTYHAVRNVVKNENSKYTDTFKNVVDKRNFGGMIINNRLNGKRK